MSALPSVAGGGSLPTTTAAPPTSLADAITQLQAAVEQLSQLVTQLAPATAVQGAQAGADQITGGGPGGSVTQAPSGGCGMAGCGGMDGSVGAVAGADAVGQGADAGIQAQGAHAAKAKPKHAKPQHANGHAQPATAPTDTSAPVADIATPKKNPRTAAEAIAWAKQAAASGDSKWYNLCLSFVAHAYGWPASGTATALKQWNELPGSMQHQGDRNPPPGALLFWKHKGSSASDAGHVAIYLGDGKIASNDIVSKGKISIVPVGDIEKKWGQQYLGWSPPYFKNA
jgi:hypothetical protein